TRRSSDLRCVSGAARRASRFFSPVRSKPSSRPFSSIEARPAMSEMIMRMSLPSRRGSVCWYRSGSTRIALACRPALCAKALSPTYGARGLTGMLTISPIAWAIRVVSASVSAGTSAIPIFSWRSASIVIRSALPVRSPYPLTQACTWLAPARPTRGPGAADGAAGVVVGVRPQARVRMTGRVQAFPQLGDDLGDVMREHAAVGVAQDGDLCSGRQGGGDHRRGVLRVVPEAVEEVLGVDEDLAAEFDQVRDGLTHHCQVLLAGGAQGGGDMAQIGLRDQGDGRGSRLDQRRDLRVVGDRDPGLAGGPERRQPGGGQLQL